MYGRTLHFSKAMSISIGSLCSWKVITAVCRKVRCSVSLCRKVHPCDSFLGNLYIEEAGNPFLVNHSRTSSSELSERFSEVITPLTAFSLS